MKHEKIIRRSDGSRIRIKVELTIEWNNSEPRWSFITHKCEKGKRTWRTHVDTDCYQWRRLSREDREKENERRSLILATREEVNEVMIELWEAVKPVETEPEPEPASETYPHWNSLTEAQKDEAIRKA